MLVQATTLITYVGSALPSGIALKWFDSRLAEAVLLGLVVFLVDKPSPAATPA